MTTCPWLRGSSIGGLPALATMRAPSSACTRHRQHGVDVRHAMHVGQGAVVLAVEGEACGVDRPVAMADRIAQLVNFDRVVHADLAVGPPERVQKDVAGAS